ncbi:SDA1-domain-containing protein [Gymnopus androsaceus JB14]|uniref:Protein SDA1 n=1 Tax=Gymnopus androsaceus JB14 TaxID=1447944 RepID=A0A6A4I8T2_9AGAR|nr:SDA1-domain-containing protein [Gymnopus androsaceus JB14]
MGGRSVLLTSNLPQLQNLIKRDPTSYKDEFLQQWNHYNSIRLIFHLNPDEHAQHFRELVAFIAQVATCYPKETAEFPSQISTILLESYGLLSPDTRKALIATMVLLRNKNVITSIELLRTLFPLLPRTTSSSLRTNIRKTILSDIRTANIRAKNHKLNRAIQAMLFGMVENGLDDVSNFGNKGKQKEVNNGVNFGSSDRTAGRGEDAMWAVILTKELWRKGIWNDVKPVSIVAIGCLHPVLKVQSASIHFFLGDDDQKDASDDEEEEDVDVRALHHRREINKKTRSGDKKLQKKLTAAKKKKHAKSTSIQANFPALHLLNDPQTFAEKLFVILDRYDKRFTLDHKILIMQLLARVISAHTLFVMPFYSYVQKWLAPKQLRVPSILVALAQSVHTLIPPQTLKPVVMKLSNEFVHPGVGSEVIAAGINAITEICRRQPLVMGPKDDDDNDQARKQKGRKKEKMDVEDGADEATKAALEKEKADIDSLGEIAVDGKRLNDKDVDLRPLLNDLIEYRKSKDKVVIAASRGLLHLYRESHPEFLKKRERGKEASINMKTSAARNLPFGHSADAAVDIEGLSLLESHFKQLREEENEDSDALSGEEEGNEAAWEGWDVESDSDSDSVSEDGWQDVSSDSDGDIDISDSEDENGDKDKSRANARETERHEKRREKREKKEKRRVKEEARKNGQEGLDDDEIDEHEYGFSGDEDDRMDVDGEVEKVEPEISSLATTKILTPADFKLLSELRVQAAQKSIDAGGGNRAKRKLAALEADLRSSRAQNPSDDPAATFISENDILGPRKKAKADYAERMASVQKGREGREKFGSRKGKKTKDAPSSSTNKEKARNKPIMMILSSGSVRGKKKASLRDKQRKLRAHIEKGKKAKR